MRHPALLAALLAALPVAAAPESYTIDSRHTFPAFEVNHYGYSIQRGRFNKTSGKIVLDLAAKTGSVDVSIETASVSTGLDKLEDRLRAEEFFDAAKFPAITFKSRKFNFDGDKVTSIEGDFTLRGVTRPVTLTASHFTCAAHPMVKRVTCGAELVATIKRSEYGVNYSLPSVADDVLLRLNVQALKD
jgi:polyisoprenoid-binding protein YceI